MIDNSNLKITRLAGVVRGGSRFSAGPKHGYGIEGIERIEGITAKGCQARSLLFLLSLPSLSQASCGGAAASGSTGTLARANTTACFARSCVASIHLEGFHFGHRVCSRVPGSTGILDWEEGVS